MKGEIQTEKLHWRFLIMLCLALVISPGQASAAKISIKDITTGITKVLPAVKTAISTLFPSIGAPPNMTVKVTADATTFNLELEGGPFEQVFNRMFAGSVTETVGSTTTAFWDYSLNVSISDDANVTIGGTGFETDTVGMAGSVTHRHPTLGTQLPYNLVIRAVDDLSTAPVNGNGDNIETKTLNPLPSFAHGASAIDKLTQARLTGTVQHLGGIFTDDRSEFLTYQLIVSAAHVPEPTSLALAAGGMAMISAWRRRPH